MIAVGQYLRFKDEVLESAYFLGALTIYIHSQISNLYALVPKNYFSVEFAADSIIN